MRGTTTATRPLSAGERAELQQLRQHLPANLGETVDSCEIKGTVRAVTLFRVDTDDGTGSMTTSPAGYGITIVGGDAFAAGQTYRDGQQVGRSDA